MKLQKVTAHPAQQGAVSLLAPLKSVPAHLAALLLAHTLSFGAGWAMRTFSESREARAWPGVLHEIVRCRSAGLPPGEVFRSAMRCAIDGDFALHRNLELLWDLCALPLPERSGWSDEPVSFTSK